MQFYTANRNHIKRLLAVSNFCKRELRLSKVKIKITQSTNIGLEDKARLIWKKVGSLFQFEIILNVKPIFNIDDQVKAVCHEFVHCEQIVYRKCDPDKGTWFNKQYANNNSAPWEIDARRRSEDLYVKFNRYMRLAAEKDRRIKLHKIENSEIMKPENKLYERKNSTMHHRADRPV